MSTYPPPGPGGFGRRLKEAMDRIETELRQAVACMNDSVVPQVRRESIAGLRHMAERLRDLADWMEASSPRTPAAASTVYPGPANPEQGSRL